MYDFSQYASPFSFPFGPAALLTFLPLLIVLMVWSLVLKGFALWYAARAKQTGWFVALLILNTVGILEIIYLIWFRPKEEKPQESVVVPNPPPTE